MEPHTEAHQAINQAMEVSLELPPPQALINQPVQLPLLELEPPHLQELMDHTAAAMAPVDQLQAQVLDMEHSQDQEPELELPPPLQLEQLEPQQLATDQAQVLDMELSQDQEPELELPPLQVEQLELLPPLLMAQDQVLESVEPLPLQPQPAEAEQLEQLEQPPLQVELQDTEHLEPPMVPLEPAMASQAAFQVLNQELLEAEAASTHHLKAMAQATREQLEPLELLQAD
jgi:hypothetical protein